VRSKQEAKCTSFALLCDIIDVVVLFIDLLFYVHLNHVSHEDSGI